MKLRNSPIISINVHSYFHEQFYSSPRINARIVIFHTEFTQGPPNYENLAHPRLILSTLHSSRILLYHSNVTIRLSASEIFLGIHLNTGVIQKIARKKEMDLSQLVSTY